MNSNFFFKKKNLKLNKIFSNKYLTNNFLVNNVKPLHLAQKNDITFYILNRKKKAFNVAFNI